jgi:hypothetical protein
MSRMRSFAIFVMSALGLVACASHPTPRPTPPNQGEASYHLASGGMTRYALSLGEIATGGVPLAHPAPVYPPALLASCPAAVELHALLIVDTAGKVSEVRIDSADRYDPAFAAAVRATALQWRFEPLQFEHWAADADGNSHPVDSETRPFSLSYAFHFACHDGKPQTGSSAAAAAP